MRRKGSVSIWIWIIGGLVIGILTFTVAYNQLGNLWTQSIRQDVVSDFETLNNDISFICSQSTGSRTSTTVELHDVMAVFSNSSRGEAPLDSMEKINDGETEKGEYVCLTFLDQQHYGCRQHSCEVNMTYIGEPLPDSTMYRVGQSSPGFKFELDIEKTGESEVLVEATHLP